MTPWLLRSPILIIFAISGFSGLIYESVWTHYLKIFLGHSAYAQALVLIIFMGGMALGSWLVSKFCNRIRNLLLAYALVEGVIGILGLFFHELFISIYAISFEIIIPGFDSSVLAHIYKITVASFLILPQSILLGATFPLMCGGLIRKFPEDPGKTISYLYFSNSIGAVAALLVSAFYLIGKLGLPGTIFTAGLINIAISIFVYYLSKNIFHSPVIKSESETKINERDWLFIAVALFTGMASFIYEISWIRMLSMVLSSTFHSFEIMLSAFILGLALGGFIIRNRIDQIKNPLMVLSIIQIVMGLFALSTIYLYNYCFEIMSFLIAALEKSDQGYMLFNTFSHGIALLVMLPTTICAGMTLPLLTLILIRQGHGEKSPGYIYSSNTIGAIFGVLFAIFIGMPLLGLKGSLLSGAIIDIILGIVLIKKSIVKINQRTAYPPVIAITTLLLVTVFAYEFDTKRMSSGVFRHGFYNWEDGTDVLFHEDGKTSSISVVTKNNDVILISTNGKPDASITMNSMQNPTLDEITMKLLAALPLSIHPNASNIANIGMGSGLTTHMALIPSRIKQVDTIEIEEAMVSGARYFLPKTERTFNDSRSKIHIEDARTFFPINKMKYDIIISEPSNPWVSGVSSLFTQEFYSLTSNYLNENGIFTQWIHIYEFNLDLIASILKSISSVFPYFSIYYTDTDNLILIASLDRPIPLPDSTIFNSTEMSEQLEQINIKTLQDISFRFLGDQDLYKRFIQSRPVPANSDFFPILSIRAPKYRFLREEVTELLEIRLSSFPILDLLYFDNKTYNNNLTITETSLSTTSKAASAYKIYELFQSGEYSDNYNKYVNSISYLKNAADQCDSVINEKIWLNSLFDIFESTIVYLNHDQIIKMVDSFTPDCDSERISESDHFWLIFFESISKRDIESISSISEQLLISDDRLNESQKKYLYTALLVCLIKQEQYRRASELWNNEAANLFTGHGNLPMNIMLLLATIDQRISDSQ